MRKRGMLICHLFLVASISMGISACRKGGAAMNCYTPGSIEGKWELVACIADPGDGSADWIGVNEANRSMLEFNSDGSVTGDFSIDIIAFHQKDSTHLIFTFRNGEERTVYYEISPNGRRLEMSGMCIERCGSRFERIACPN